jgi:hypothetical protein
MADGYIRLSKLVMLLPMLGKMVKGKCYIDFSLLGCTARSNLGC